LWGEGLRSRRLRHGWYGVRDLPVEVRDAWVAGGSLACISALALAARSSQPPGGTGTAAPSPRSTRAGTSSGPDLASTALHICVPTSAARIPRTSLMGGRTVPVIVHWSTADFTSGSRLSVTPATAERQARQCRKGTDPPG